MGAYAVKQRGHEKDEKVGKNRNSKEVWYLIYPEVPVDQVSQHKGRSPPPYIEEK